MLGVVQEFGMPRGYYPSRDTLFSRCAPPVAVCTVRYGAAVQVYAEMDLTCLRVDLSGLMR